MPYRILRNPSEEQLNELAAEGFRVACIVPITKNTFKDHVETIIDVYLENTDFFHSREYYSSYSN